MHFRFYPLRFEFIAQDSLFFPSGKATNILRGALGSLFRKLACASNCTDAKSCEMRDSCAYARVFEPTNSEGPSGLADSPRPFVFRARHLDGHSVQAGETFWFDLNVFSLDRSVLAYFVLTFASLAREGLGPRRGRANLTRVLKGERVFYDGLSKTISSNIEPVALDLTPAPSSPRRIRVQFLTPTELKHDNKIARQPEFPILFGRIRDRVATLSRLYGADDLAIDYQGTNLRATAVKMIRCQLRRHEPERRSSKTGQAHSIGGFVGEAVYEGDLAEFLPLLELGRWTGVGRQSVWGKGEINIQYAG